MVNKPEKTNESDLTADDVSVDLTSNASDLVIGFGFPSTSQFPAGEHEFVPSASSADGAEGRVHGGSLMAILKSGSVPGHLDNEESFMIPQGWI